MYVARARQIECFTFLRMGGTMERVTVMPLMSEEAIGGEMVDADEDARREASFAGAHVRRYWRR